MRALFLPVKSGLPGGARRVFCFERKPMNLTLASGKVTKSFVAGALALSVSGVAVPASFAALAHQNRRAHLLPRLAP